jgi:hypothetical protein
MNANIFSEEQSLNFLKFNDPLNEVPKQNCVDKKSHKFCSIPNCSLTEKADLTVNCTKRSYFKIEKINSEKALNSSIDCFNFIKEKEISPIQKKNIFNVEFCNQKFNLSADKIKTSNISVSDIHSNKNKEENQEILSELEVLEEEFFHLFDKQPEKITKEWIYKNLLK